MHNHFDRYLNLQRWILERRPKVVVECGAGTGELTRLLASLLNIYDFELHVISDRPVEGLDSRIKWYSGLSYNVLEGFPNDSIELCIIDTDHNYWTLKKEFAAVFHKIAEGGLIALHDVFTFYHDTGMAMSYSTGEPYPQEEIEAMAPHGSLGDAMLEFLFRNNMRYRLLAFTHESNGAALIEKKAEPVFTIVVPGPKPAYAEHLATARP